jgi:hypothetical protein
MKQIRQIVVALFLGGLVWTMATVGAEEGIPADYKLTSPPNVKAPTNITRLVTLARYLNDKLNEAGGKNSPKCYHNCLTVALNEVQTCMNAMGTFADTESCERDAAWAISQCDPKCE